MDLRFPRQTTAFFGVDPLQDDDGTPGMCVDLLLFDAAFGDISACDSRTAKLFFVI